MKPAFTGLLAFSSFLAAAGAISPHKKPPRSIVNETITAEELLGSHWGPIDITESYDYVVVGGGTAGLTIARRLAAQYTVAVVEAGSLYELDNANLTATVDRSLHGT